MGIASQLTLFRDFPVEIQHLIALYSLPKVRFTIYHSILKFDRYSPIIKWIKFDPTLTILVGDEDTFHLSIRDVTELMKIYLITDLKLNIKFCNVSSDDYYSFRTFINFYNDHIKSISFYITHENLVQCYSGLNHFLFVNRTVIAKTVAVEFEKYHDYENEFVKICINRFLNLQRLVVGGKMIQKFPYNSQLTLLEVYSSKCDPLSLTKNVVCRFPANLTKLVVKNSWLVTNYCNFFQLKHLHLVNVIDYGNNLPKFLADNDSIKLITWKNVVDENNDPIKFDYQDIESIQQYCQTCDIELYEDESKIDSSVED